MTDQPGSGTPEQGSDPGQGYGQPGSHPGQAPYPGQAPTPGYPLQPPTYPGQQPTYPGQGAPQQPTYGYPAQPSYASPDPGAYLGAPAYPGYPGAPDPNAPRRYSGWAIAAFVTGLLLPLVGILVAVPLGIVALVKISRTGAKGRWMAIVGIVLSVLWWVGVIALALWANSNQAQRNDAGVIDKAGTLDFGDIRAGDCVTISGLGGGGAIGAFDIKGVPCVDSHNAQAVFVVTFPEASYPGETAIGNQAQQACSPAYRPYRSLSLQSYTLYPTQSRWDESHGHRAICFLTHGGGQTMTGSVLK